MPPKFRRLLNDLIFVTTYKAVEHAFNGLFYGTGSYPLPPQGLHLRMRLKASQPPLNGPYFFIASTAYCEQVGV